MTLEQDLIDDGYKLTEEGTDAAGEFKIFKKDFITLKLRKV